MATDRIFILVSASALMSTPLVALCRAQDDAPLPAGVKAVWDLEKAYREKTPTRERVCLNGLWRWQPSSETKAEH